MIAKDEERDLPGCLLSLKALVSEIVVVVDDATTDRTEELARGAGAKVIRRRFDDYARQRQASLDAATGEWCLWIDPDERLTPELAGEIREAVESGAFDGYALPFSVLFLGRRLRWGGLGSESHLRLFRRAKSRFGGGLLHEGVRVDGPVGRLRGRVLHEPYRDLADYESKLDRYTTLAARKRLAEGRRPGPLDALRGPWELFARLVLKLGFLDGAPGVLWARLAARHTRLKYAKLKKMQEERP